MRDVLRVTVQIDAPDYMAMAVKEALAIECEKYGDVRVVSVEGSGKEQRQITMENYGCF